MKYIINQYVKSTLQLPRQCNAKSGQINHYKSS